jgi:hypothetical protein
MMGWLLPVGTPGGICSGMEGIPDGSGLVRLGDELMYVDSELYRIWRASGAAPETRELLDWAAARGISNAEVRIRSLLDAELVVEERPHVEARIGRLAIRLTGECIGNGTALGTKFAVLGRDGARVNVDAYSFEALLRSDGVTSVSTICDALEEELFADDQRACLSTLTAGLPILVRAGAIRLDAALGP